MVFLLSNIPYGPLGRAWADCSDFIRPRNPCPVASLHNLVSWLVVWIEGQGVRACRQSRSVVRPCVLNGMEVMRRIIWRRCAS